MRLQGHIDSCIQQCQGSPHLLKLIDASVRLRIPDAESRSTVNTLSDKFKAHWSACATQLLSRAAGAQAAAAHFNAYAIWNHEIYLQLLQQVTAPPHGASTPTAAACMSKVVLRVIVQLSSSEWYPWSALEAAVAEEATLVVPLHARVASFFGVAPSSASRDTAASASTLRGNSDSVAEEVDGNGGVAITLQPDDSITMSPFAQQFDAQLLADIDAALRLLVQHRVLETQAAKAGQGVHSPTHPHMDIRYRMHACRALASEPASSAP